MCMRMSDIHVYIYMYMKYVYIYMLGATWSPTLTPGQSAVQCTIYHTEVSTLYTAKKPPSYNIICRQTEYPVHHKWSPHPLLVIHTNFCVPYTHNIGTLANSFWLVGYSKGSPQNKCNVQQSKLRDVLARCIENQPLRFPQRDFAVSRHESASILHHLSAN